MTTLPALGAIHVHQSEPKPPSQRDGSPASRVAHEFVTQNQSLVPGIVIRSAKLSLAGLTTSLIAKVKVPVEAPFPWFTPSTAISNWSPGRALNSDVTRERFVRSVPR